MHSLLLVTLALADADTSADARSAVYDELLHDESFCGSGGRFGSPLCDWFVIGGRWSGLLRTKLLGEPYQQALEALYPPGLTHGERDRYRASRRDEFDALWQQNGGEPPAPCFREDNTYGHADDALPLDVLLYEQFLAAYAGEAAYLSHGHCEFVDLDDESLGRSFLGRKWLVVVDYHS